VRLNVKEAATRARVSEIAIYAWCADGRLPHFRLGAKCKGGRIQIEEADLDAYIESCRVGPPPKAKPAKMGKPKGESYSILSPS
jgi:excisionase family DNA binding protein